MNPIHLILLLLSFVCFGLSAWRIADPDWRRLLSVGLAFFVASFINW